MMWEGSEECDVGRFGRTRLGCKDVLPPFQSPRVMPRLIVPHLAPWRSSAEAPTRPGPRGTHASGGAASLPQGARTGAGLPPLPASSQKRAVHATPGVGPWLLGAWRRETTRTTDRKTRCSERDMPNTLHEYVETHAPTGNNTRCRGAEHNAQCAVRHRLRSCVPCAAVQSVGHHMFSGRLHSVSYCSCSAPRFALWHTAPRATAVRTAPLRQGEVTLSMVCAGRGRASSTRVEGRTAMGPRITRFASQGRPPAGGCGPCILRTVHVHSALSAPCTCGLFPWGSGSGSGSGVHPGAFFCSASDRLPQTVHSDQRLPEDQCHASGVSFGRESGDGLALVRSTFSV